MRLADYFRWPRRRGRGSSVLEARDRSVGPAELVAKRDRLSSQLAELQWDLGGLVYEMARRDHFRLELVVSQAADLQSVDAELGEVERLLHLEQAGAGGACPACGALHARGAVYCWQCGTDLMSRGPVGGDATATQAGGVAAPAPEVGGPPAPGIDGAPPPPPPAVDGGARPDVARRRFEPPATPDPGSVPEPQAPASPAAPGAPEPSASARTLDPGV